MPTLQLRVKDSRSQPIRLGEDAVTVGRHPDNRIRVKDDRSSRHHCVIEQHDGGFRVRDLGSRNGTSVNGKTVEEAPVNDGDEIRVGDLVMLVERRQSVVDRGDAADHENGNGNGAAPAARRRRGREKEEVVPPWVNELKGVIDAFTQPGVADAKLVLIDSGGRSTEALLSNADGPRAFRLLLRCANRTRATDIHVEPKGESYNVRMRVDGQMVWVTEMPNKVGELLGGMVKTARQMPQTHTEAVLDGHFSCRFPDRRVEYRVSFTPSIQGQKLVIRVLDQRGVPTALTDLGMIRYMEERLRQFVLQDSGMLLACGPTGSGKTTTLYNALREIDRQARNVVTIEDPVEYQIDSVTQIPVDRKRGNDFNDLLRSVLRQDPDVILVGEIRDEPTARTAMQAAMTGHLVFSTVHSKDSISAVFRLLDLKVEPYLVANSLQLVMAQRLVRTLCEHCRDEVPIKPGQATRMGRAMAGRSTAYAAVGCPKCLKTGYRGRHALFELLDVDDELRDVILHRPSLSAMRKVIDGGLFTTLAQFGWRLVAEGVTSVDEVDRIASSG